MSNADDYAEEVDRVAGQIYKQTEMVLTRALQELSSIGDNIQPHHLFIVLQSASAGLIVAAKLMTIPDAEAEEDAYWPSGPTDRTAIVAAALLAARCLVPISDGFKFDFGPLDIKAALDATARVLGGFDQTILTKPMVSAANSYPSPDHFLDNTYHNDGLDGLHTIN
jgi:hypothetical protein